MIEHHIALIVSEEIEKNLLRAWFHAVRDNAPEGVVVTVQVDGKPVQIVKSKDSEVRYMVPLSRDLTDAEVKSIIDAFSHATDVDFKVKATTSPLDISVSPEIEIDHDPMIELCTGWAKKKHEDWMSAKTASGWRYGPSVSTSNKPTLCFVLGAIFPPSIARSIPHRRRSFSIFSATPATLSCAAKTSTS